MTTPFHDFLTWFDGWSENIEGTPTEKQWERLKSKLSEVRDASPEPAAVIIRESNGVQTADGLPPIDQRPRKQKATVATDPKVTWTARYKAHLVSIGYDPESAQEMMPPAIDPSTDPIAAANAAHKGMN